MGVWAYVVVLATAARSPDDYALTVSPSFRLNTCFGKLTDVSSGQTVYQGSIMAAVTFGRVGHTGGEGINEC